MLVAMITYYGIVFAISNLLLCAQARPRCFDMIKTFAKLPLDAFLFGRMMSKWLRTTKETT